MGASSSSLASTLTDCSTGGGMSICEIVVGIQLSHPWVERSPLERRREACSLCEGETSGEWRPLTIDLRAASALSSA